MVTRGRHQFGVLRLMVALIVVSGVFALMSPVVAEVGFAPPIVAALTIGLLALSRSVVLWQFFGPPSWRPPCRGGAIVYGA